MATLDKSTISFDVLGAIAEGLQNAQTGISSLEALADCLPGLMKHLSNKMTGALFVPLATHPENWPTRHAAWGHVDEILVKRLDHQTGIDTVVKLVSADEGTCLSVEQWFPRLFDRFGQSLIDALDRLESPYVAMIMARSMLTTMHNPGLLGGQPDQAHEIDPVVFYSTYKLLSNMPRLPPGSRNTSNREEQLAHRFWSLDKGTRGGILKLFSGQERDPFQSSVEQYKVDYPKSAQVIHEVTKAVRLDL